MLTLTINRLRLVLSHSQG